MIDTDILIDHPRGVASATAFLSASRTAGTNVISIITAMELVQGCRSGRELQTVRRLLAAMVVVSVTERISETAFRLMDALYLRHGLRLPDALIGASALERGGVLSSRNVRHIGAIPGLTVQRPD